jgi:membrane protease subunit HflC
MRTGIVIATLIVLLLTFNGTVFTLSEGQQALITQFGQIQGAPITAAGLHFKRPFINDVRYFDKRILSWDGDPEQIPTKDKKYIWVDTTARWKIKDLVKFAETVQNENGARARLDGILDGVTRDTISNHNLVEAVRNSNGIFEQIEQRRSEAAAGNAVVEEEITGEIERINKGREQLSRLIIERARRELEAFGIELIDVQLRRIAYEKSVEDKVYERMISERNRVAEKIRSIGKGEDAKIRGKLNRDLKEIESLAYRKSQEKRGEAEGKAIGIMAEAVKVDPDYFEFTRTLEAYKKALEGKGHFILSTDSDFLSLLQKRR